MILAVERKPDQNPQDISIRPATLPEEMTWSFLAYPAAFATSPFILMDMSKNLLSPPTGRPFEECCYVWIEDTYTGKVASGRKPN